MVPAASGADDTAAALVVAAPKVAEKNSPDAPLVKHYRSWFLEYASYVLLDRAVPHLDDGLKPVQRRILHTLWDMDDGRFHKVAHVVGRAMSLHPHGDASIGAALLIMHSKGEPKIAHKHITYPDVMDELLTFFSEKTAIALHSGVKRESLILDPGIDFAKQAPDNLRIYRELEKLTTLGFPILLPVSRKSVIGRVLGIERPQDRDAGTIACIVAGCLRGASIFRVHNVSAAWFAIRTAEVLQ